MTAWPFECGWYVGSKSRWDSCQFESRRAVTPAMNVVMSVMCWLAAAAATSMSAAAAAAASLCAISTMVVGSGGAGAWSGPPWTMALQRGLRASTIVGGSAPSSSGAA